MGIYIQSKRERGRSKKKWGDVIESNMWWPDVSEEDAGDRIKW